MKKLIRQYFISGLFFFTLITFAEGVVIQVDSDLSGEPDQWQHKSKDGKLIKIEYDKNGDGKVDQVDNYDGNDQPIKVELDRDFDGTLDQIQYYNKQFNLTHIEKDSSSSSSYLNLFQYV